MKFHIFRNNKGFTLIEVMLSLALIFLLVFTLYKFFLEAYDYTMENKSKTIAVNIARNVVNYMEKQNFFVMEKYIEQNKGSDKFVKLTWENCVEDQSCVKKDEEGNRDLSDCGVARFEDFPLFTSGVDDEGNEIADGSICLSVLAPIINNMDYKDNNQVVVYITEFYDEKSINDQINDQIIDLLKSENDEAEITKGINSIIGTKSPDYQSQLLKIFVVVTWNEKRDNIVLEGVISDEAFR
ncbi:type IV pilus modification PilV family protein [Calidifontibacillus erzurumensis]|uniref:type IV pilus modification PilV family protein n=1 Tax=Calidifontibacillus erzurumensis TaxID=2741433 RepID=UPI0035B51E38